MANARAWSVGDNFDILFTKIKANMLKHLIWLRKAYRFRDLNHRFLAVATCFNNLYKSMIFNNL